MSEKKTHFPQNPSAPMGGLPNYEYANHRGPPPTYEESQTNPYRPPPNYATGPQFGQTSMPHFTNQPYPPMNGIPPFNNQQGPYQQHSQHYGVVYPPAPQYTGMPQTVEFNASARFGKSGGSVTIPPPPPGCMPTPAQLAALQGQPVILKKKKNSFF